MKQQLRAGDRETQTLQERLQDATRQIALLKEKDKVQRQELLESVEKQEDLQRELVAVNLRWENRWQDQQQELDERHELRLRELQQVKQRLLGEKQAVEERLVQAENDVQRLRSELSSLKSSARIAESFGSQHLARRSDARSSSESVPAPSPLWSDDPGTLSPIPGMSPLLMGSPVLQPTRASASLDALEVENAKLRDVIQQMEEALAHQAEETPSSGSRSASKLAAQLLEAQERCVALERQLQEKDVNAMALQLESCQRELAEAQSVIEAKTKRIAQLETQLEELEGLRSAEPELQSGRVAMETQVTSLQQKLDAANSDIERLVRERSQLMELSNQLRADLRRSGSDAGSRSSTPRVDFAGKKDYENLIAELTQSLEEARVHNKTLKKELRRMVKLQMHLEQERGARGEETTTRTHTSRSESTTSRDDDDQDSKRRSSTLSMMKTLDPGSTRSAGRSSSASTRSASSKSDLDDQLLALARNKRPSSRKQSTSSRRTTRVPSTISEHGSDSEADVSAPDEEARPDRRPASSADKSPLERLFQPVERRDSGASNSSAGGSSAKVTDARLKLQQAKEMLMLSGKRAPGTASLASFAAGTATGTPTLTRLSDRETSSQRSAIKKMKQLQSKRAEMVSERKKVRNYSLGP